MIFFALLIVINVMTIKHIYKCIVHMSYDVTAKVFKTNCFVLFS